jgi:SAM-dependent methyltransferase
MPEPVVLTAADIARLAGVTRATVSNWRRRHPDFPEPSSGTDASPAYDRGKVETWLAGRGLLPELPPDEQLWRALLDAAEGNNLGDVVASVALDLQETARRTRAGARASSLDQTTSNQAQIARALAEVEAKYGRGEILGILIGRYTDAVGLSITPRPVAGLMAELADAGEGTILDPAAGTGQLLAAALDRGARRVAGQELDPALARLAETRLLMATSQGKAEIRAGDSLLQDAYDGLQADAVLCHPPFASRDWHHGELAGDARWKYGIPPKSESELAWAQHALAHLRPGGRAVLLMPPAVASRPSGRRIRAGMLRDGAIRAIISLPPGTIRPSHIPIHVWVLERPAGTGRVAHQVLLADTAARPKMADTAPARSPAAWQQLPNTVLAAWRSFSTAGADSMSDKGEPGLWRAVRAIDLLDETVDLTPARHVGTVQTGKSPSETSNEVQVLRGRVRSALAALDGWTPGDGWLPRTHLAAWRTVTVEDLARSGMLSLYRAPRPAPADADLTIGARWPDSRSVLTAADVRSGSPPTAVIPGDAIRPEWVEVSAGDVIIPAGLDSLTQAIVATERHDGAFLGENLHLIRPDLSRIDPRFLSGFLSARPNVRQASYGTTAIRVDARRLMVPLLPMDEQHSYAAAFRELRDFDVAVREFGRTARELTRLLDAGLAEGTLMPAKRHEGIPSGHVSHRTETTSPGMTERRRP